jgi:hypothetical protein
MFTEYAECVLRSEYIHQASRLCFERDVTEFPTVMLPTTNLVFPFIVVCFLDCFGTGDI